MIGIVIYTRITKDTASLTSNIIGTSLATALLIWHFFNFYPRRQQYKKEIEIVLVGIKMERDHAFLKSRFFSDYLKDFNTIGYIMKMMLFDVFLIYFFSYSYTQLLNAINPVAVEKLRDITPFSTGLITLSLGWAYYKAIKPLSLLKRGVA